MNKQQLASKIWESANKMRSKIEANEYKDYILGFIFYKFLSDKEVKFLTDEGWDADNMKQVVESDEETRKHIQRNIGYFIAYENLFSTWIHKGHDFEASNVTDALSAFNRLINPSHKKVFDKVFDTLQTGLSKLGETSGKRTKAIRDLIYLIRDIPMDGRQEYDVLGFIYEYLLSNFAAKAKKAGEFYTPHEVSLLMSEIVADHLKDRQRIKVYDPTSGSGSLLINIGKCIVRYMGSENNIKYYAQEFKENAYNLTRMNLVMRGILPDNITTRNGDTLEEDWPYFEDTDPVGTYDPLYVDAVVSNPPYSQPWNPTGKESDPRYKKFGLAPKTKADYAFLLHDLYHLKSDGIITIVLPHGVLFRSGTEGTIRKNLIEENHIDAIIGLPANVFFGTGIPTLIMVLKKKRENTDVLIVDASKGFAKVGQKNILRACDIKKIVDTVTQRTETEKYSRVVSLAEIRANEYNLNIPRYVNSSEKGESWDIYATMFGGIPKSELAELGDYWNAFPRLQDALYESLNAAYCHPKVKDIKEAVLNHPDVTKFFKSYETAFSDFEAFLYDRVIEGMTTLSISQEEAVISDNIFARLYGIPLVDKYKAYQLLHEEWKKIAVDLEIIHTEGFAATKQVDPHIVMKKKDGQEQDVQEGWCGRVIPFALVQETILSTELAALRTKEVRLNEISAEYSRLLDELSEEDKDKDFVNDKGDAFVPNEVEKTLRNEEAEPETLVILAEVVTLNNEGKRLKKQIKDAAQALHLLTKKTIEGLDDEQATHLIELKWLQPILNSMAGLPAAIVSDFVSQLSALSVKYETTLTEVDRQLTETEAELASLLDELTGNEFDMQGVKELKFLLGGNAHE